MSQVRNRLQNIKFAIKNSDSSLANLDKEHYKKEFYGAKLNLGIAYTALSDYENTEKNLDKTEDYLHECKEFFFQNYELYGELYMHTLVSLSILYNRIYDINKEIFWLNQAKDILIYVNKIINIETFPIRYGNMKYFLGLTRTKLALKENNIDSLKLAVWDFDGSLNIFKSDKFKFLYTRSIMHRAEAVGYLGIRTFPPNESMINSALDSLKSCLAIFTLQDYPLYYALTNKILGDIYLSNSSFKNSKENLLSAKKHFEEVIKIFNPNNFGKILQRGKFKN